MTPQRAHRADPPTDAVADRNATPENDATRAPTDARTRAVRSNRGKSLGTQLVVEWHPTRNGNLTPADVTAGSGRKVWWVCAVGHEWQAQVVNRSRRSGCPACATAARGSYKAGRLPGRLAAQWHPTLNGALTPDQVTAGSKRKVWWVCPEGHEWAAKINNRFRGSGCPSCAGHVGAQLSDHLVGQWHPTRNGDLAPGDVTAGSGRRVWWVCEQGHEWEAQVVGRSYGAGCPRCAGRTQSSPLDPVLAAQWHPTKNGDLTPCDVTAGSKQKAWWVCPEEHEWEARIESRSRGRCCPACQTARRTRRAS